MISHEIVKHKPRVLAWSTPNNTTQIATPSITCQSDLDTWLTETPFAVGDYVTYYNSNRAITAMYLPNSVYKILSVCTDIRELQYQTYVPYNPKLIQIEGLRGSSHVQIPARWDDIRNVRKLTETEYHDVLKPYLDKL